MPILLFAFLCIEAVLLIKLGQSVGGGLVLIEIILSGALGYALFRLAGRAIVRTDDLISLFLHPRESARRPGWAMIIAAILLLIPGLLTDVLGLGLLVRHLFRGGTLSLPSEPDGDPDVIDIKFSVDPEDDRK